MNRKNCIIVDDEPMARAVIVNHLDKINGINVVAECANAMEAFSILSKDNIDLIFLDINMPEISGITLAKSINPEVKIIFTTAYRDYAVEGFELRALDYLLKPISFERLLKAINTYFEVYIKQNNSIKNKEENQQDFLFVRADRKMVKINLSCIKYVESYSDYIKIHTEDNIVVTRETISSIEEKLPDETFIRIHRSYIVSLNHIKSFTKEYVSISGKDLSISRSYKKSVLEKLDNI